MADRSPSVNLDPYVEPDIGYCLYCEEDNVVICPACGYCAMCCRQAGCDGR
jgi:hypothetical protein